MDPQPPSFDEHLASSKSFPLFMSSLPDEPTDNSALSAPESLVHEGTPDEIAQNFKKRGNKHFKQKRYREALGFYTQGVDSKPNDARLREALLMNRAACNLELQNYESVLRDCAAIITANPRTPKAYYRAGIALLALERVEEVLDVCTRGCECMADDVELMARHEEWRQKEAERREERNLIEVPNPEDIVNPYEAEFNPEDQKGGTLIMPVFFLYPEHTTWDVIPEFVEDTTFGAHLAFMFPPGESSRKSWDTERKYVDDGSLVVYAITRQKRLLKVGREMTLRDVCRAAGGGGEHDGLVVRDGGLAFIVVPKGEVERKWIEEYRSALEQRV
ncbi:hypothetical protein BC826DRAFT_1039620 [Russula brevipes]|nr:hypothetical protein BC826DRAFT_1039620 [Russula brevipes]